MKTKVSQSYVVMTILAAATLFFGNWARAGLVNTSSFLASAGFRACKPETPEQRLLYGVAPSYKLLRAGSPWESFYAYKDETAGVAYVGGEAEFRRFQELAVQQRYARGAYLGADMELDLAWRWLNAFGLCLNNERSGISPK